MVVLVVVVGGDVFVSAVAVGGGDAWRTRWSGVGRCRALCLWGCAVVTCGDRSSVPVCVVSCVHHHHACLTVFGILLCVSFCLVGWCVDSRPTVMPRRRRFGAGWGVRHDTRRSCSL